MLRTPFLYSLIKCKTGKNFYFRRILIISLILASLLDSKHVHRLESILNLISSEEKRFYLKVIKIILKVLPIPYIKTLVE